MTHAYKYITHRCCRIHTLPLIWYILHAMYNDTRRMFNAFVAIVMKDIYYASCTAILWEFNGSTGLCDIEASRSRYGYTEISADDSSRKCTTYQHASLYFVTLSHPLSSYPLQSVSLANESLRIRESMDFLLLMQSKLSDIVLNITTDTGLKILTRNNCVLELLEHCNGIISNSLVNLQIYSSG